MGLRELINKKPFLSTGAVVLAVGLSCSAVLWSHSGNGVRRVSKAYFSDDDGQTYFADSADRIPPFDHDGKPAYKACVFKIGDAPPAVGYLERYPDDARAKLEDLEAAPDANAQAIDNLISNAVEVKKPGDAKWFRQMSSSGETIARPPVDSQGKLAMGVVP